MASKCALTRAHARSSKSGCWAPRPTRMSRTLHAIEGRAGRLRARLVDQRLDLASEQPAEREELGNHDRRTQRTRGVDEQVCAELPRPFERVALVDRDHARLLGFGLESGGSWTISTPAAGDTCAGTGPPQ